MYDLIYKKTCIECDVTKHLSEFGVCKDKPNGRSLCRSCKREYDKEYHIKNKDRIKCLQKKYSQKNKAKIKDYLKGYRDNNKVRRQSHLKKWVLTPEGRESVYNSAVTRSAKTHGLKINLNLTGHEWFVIVNLFENKCAYCQTEQKTPSQDHVIPISKHGEHNKGNVVPSCKVCNSKKYTKELWIDFIPTNPHPKLLELHPKLTG